MPIIPFNYSSSGDSYDYVDNYNSNIDKLDLHDHDTSGFSLNQLSIIWSDVDVMGAYFYAVGYINLSSISSPILRSMYISGGEWFYEDGLGNDIQITSNGQVAYTETYTGFFGNLELYGAHCDYDAGNNQYTFSSDGDNTRVYGKDLTLSAVEVNSFKLTSSFENFSQTNFFSDRRLYETYSPSSEQIADTLCIDGDGKYLPLYTQFLDTDEVTAPSPFVTNTTTVAYNTLKKVYANPQKGAQTDIYLQTSGFTAQNKNPVAVKGTILAVSGGTDENFSSGTRRNPQNLSDYSGVTFGKIADYGQKPCFMTLRMQPIAVPEGNPLYGPGNMFVSFYSGDLDASVAIYGVSYNIVVNSGASDSLTDAADIGVSVLNYTHIEYGNDAYPTEGFPPLVYLVFKINNKKGIELSEEDINVLFSYYAINIAVGD